jgi:hypothetical protein
MFISARSIFSTWSLLQQGRAAALMKSSTGFELSDTGDETVMGQFELPMAPSQKVIEYHRLIEFDVLQIALKKNLIQEKHPGQMSAAE